MSGFHEVGRNLEIKQKIESAVVKTIESVPEKVLKPEHIETRNQKWEGQTYPGTDVSYRKSVFVQDGRLKEGVFPKFSPVFETTLPKDMRQMSDVAQFKYCTDSLAEFSPFAARPSVFYFTGGESIEQEKSSPERRTVCQGV